ncbi:substrate-binding periplasmic protein [Desulfonema magnum]|uniref:Solute-binding protein family 3 domain-containing protein, MltF-like n=1 Tax=Desulfonema magnum TaxID=45655 RepID=A0A975GUA1_9BACT|nr:transporter substrate-binding domain-containing protein [Desulfonema magnum]QTA93959.1 Solute-binding protein family 3 domain-containing protein, MltF-like [Desulfonema magnum]
MQLVKKVSMNLRNLICLMLLICSLVLINTHSSASEQLRIDTIQLPPFGFFTEDGRSTGFLYDMGSRIAEEAGFPYKNRIVPFARMVMELEQGRADFGLFFRSEKNDKIIIPVLHIASFKNVVISLKDTKYKSLESLHGKLVARVRGQDMMSFLKKISL